MKFKIIQNCDYVQGYLRYGHLEGEIEVESKEYDVYTQVYTEGKFSGFELLRVSSVEFISLDHVHSMHELYPPFLATHSELCKFSKNVLEHRLNHLDLRIDQFATYYYNEIYPNILTEEGIVLDEDLLMDEVCTFIEQLELLIHLHRRSH